jgi:uncharacterized membrane protein YfcA
VDPRLALIGLAVGFLVGLSGVGGSSLMTPLLILVLGVKPLIAVGTDLAYSVPTKLLGAYVHRGQGTVDRRTVLYLSLGGIPGAVLGLVALSALRTHLGLSHLNELLKHGVGLLLLLVAAAILLTPLLRRRHGPSPGPSWTPALKVRAVALGAVVGMLVSLTSIGSGSITVPALYLLLPGLGLRRLVGSDVAFAALLIPVAALGHMQMGSVNVALAANLVLGSLPGVFIGSKLCARLPDSWLRPALAGLLFFAGSRLI